MIRGIPECGMQAGEERARQRGALSGTITMMKVKKDRMSLRKIFLKPYQRMTP